MPDSLYCSTCNKPLTKEAIGNLCPSCLMGIGLESAETLEVTSSFGRSTPTGADDKSGPLEVGSRIGSFTLKSKLGEGGMGVVFEADDAETGRRVALKVLKQGLNTAEARGRFLREGRTAASVNHPNSVYVYGTHDINGRLLISMELVAGGTLEDEVRREGPRSVTRAVDALLQVIDGLEAAQLAGVLHRDMKPSNCFVDEAGQVKVGDFGLSISTDGSEDSLITRQDAILGTPAFSAPEQLRGEALDVQSDIYSLGGTLFYLLSGQAPFQAGTLVQLIATVLEREAPMVDSLQGNVPAELAKVLHRCLQKAPEKRWSNYADLRNALLPFSSEVSVPAHPAIRFLAGMIDQIVIAGVGILGLILFQHSEPVITLAEILIWVLYFSVAEIGFGTSPGKRLLGLRLVSTRSANLPALSILLRVGMFVTCWKSGELLTVLFGSPVMDGRMISLFFIQLLSPVLLFSIMRRSNGFSGLHDLATGVRVVHVIRSNPKTISHLAETSFTDTELAPIGPYPRLCPQEEQPQGYLSLAYDDRLLRQVWVFEPNEADLFSEARREVNRPTRLRWLNRAQPGDKSWEAFEAPAGTPLRLLAREPEALDTAMVQTWVTDLAEELIQAQADGTLPSRLNLDHVWVGKDGQVKLLDFAAPRYADQAEPEQKTQAPLAFLASVARAAHYGIDAEGGLAHSHSHRPICLTARRQIEALDAGEPLADLLASEAASPPQQTRVKHDRIIRTGMLLVPFLILLTFFFWMNRFGLGQPGFWEDKILADSELTFHCIASIGTPNACSEEDYVHYAQVLASRYPHLMDEDPRWQSDEDLALMFGILNMNSNVKQRVAAAIETHADPSPRALSNALHAATKSLRPAPSADPDDVKSNMASMNFWIYRFMLETFLILIGLPSVVAALLFRGGPMIHGFSMCVVNKQGQPAHRFRILCRSLLFTAPALLALICLRDGANNYPTLIFCQILFILLPLTSMLLPKRGLPDRLAKTWLVPR